MVSVPGKRTNIKCVVIVGAWLGHIFDTGCEVGIVLFTPNNANRQVVSSPSVCVK